MLEDRLKIIEKQLREEGRVAGLEQGREQGREAGLLEGELKLIILQLTKKFGPLSATDHQFLKSLSAKKLQQVGERLLDANTLEEALSGQSTH